MQRLSIVQILVLLGLTVVTSQGQVDFPDPSPRQELEQNFGMSGIVLSYSRPGVKGRKMIGNVDPYDSVWRAGANQPTTIRFKDPVKLGDQPVDSGAYVIYLIPRKNQDWIFILNRGVKNWGSDGYKKADDAVRLAIPVKVTNSMTETLNYSFDNVKNETIDLVIRWENWQLTIPIVTPIKEKLRVQIEANVKSEKPVYWYAAQFYYEYDKNYVKALDMISEAIKRNEKGGLKPYWQYYYKAKILKDLDRKQEAIEAATISSQMAKEHGNRNNYIKLNEELMITLTVNNRTDNNKPINQMTTLTTYLLLNGQCKQAMEFYKTCLGGELTISLVGDTPMKDIMPATMHHKVINAQLKSEGIHISASDWLRPDETPVQGNTVCLYLSGGTVQELKNLFDKLSEGAHVTDPLTETFYGLYGALNDKFGVRWMFHSDKK